MATKREQRAGDLEAPAAKMRMTGFNFKESDPSKSQGAFNNTKGFQDAFVGDPSLRKLKEEISIKERQNNELENEVTRLRYSLQDKCGENEAMRTLQTELEHKGD